MAAPIHTGGGEQQKSSGGVPVGGANPDRITTGQFLASDRMLSDLYCDVNNNNCFGPEDVGGSSLPTCSNGEILIANSSGDWECGAVSGGGGSTPASCSAETLSQLSAGGDFDYSCSYSFPAAPHGTTLTEDASSITVAARGAYATASCNDGSWVLQSATCPGVTCFTAGTKVLMADGTEKDIEEVKIGDKVRGENDAVNTVLGYDQPMLGDRKLYSFNGGPYFVTSEHPFRTTDGWKSISVSALEAENPQLAADLDVTSLEVGDEIIRADGTTEVIETIDSRPEVEQRLYNFHLDGNQTYFADGYLTHNK